MNYLTKSILLLAVFAVPVSLGASKPVVASLESPSFMLTLKVFQTGPGTAAAFWNSSVDGPFDVVVEDLSTNQVVYHNTTYENFDDGLNNLSANTLHRVTVSDIDNALVFDIFIQ